MGLLEPSETAEPAKIVNGEQRVFASRDERSAGAETAPYKLIAAGDRKSGPDKRAKAPW